MNQQSKKQSEVLESINKYREMGEIEKKEFWSNFSENQTSKETDLIKE